MTANGTESLPIIGIRHATCCSETKYVGRDDLLLIILDKGSILSGCLTKSSAPSAPVIWCKNKFKSTVKLGEPIVILVNAGNANALRVKRVYWRVREKLILYQNCSIAIIQIFFLPLQV